MINGGYGGALAAAGYRGSGSYSPCMGCCSQVLCKFGGGGVKIARNTSEEKPLKLNLINID